MNLPTLKGTKEYEEGYRAASEHRSVHECPYSYNKTPYFGRDQIAFDREYRPKLDAWFAGWTAWLDEHGLGNNFQPKRKVKRG